jgi:hypothetical protein
MMSAAFTGSILCAAEWTDREYEPVERFDPHLLPEAKLLAARSARLPELPVHVDETAASHLADRAGDQLRPDLDGPVPYLNGLAERERPDSS